MRASAEPVLRVGVVGCGFISEVYCRNLSQSPWVRLVACADKDTGRAAERAVQFGLKQMATEELLADPEIDLVVNLTVPVAHAQVSLAALTAGKHVYTEKPLATTAAEARAILTLAAQRGLRVGCAPDTTLGSTWQAVRTVVAGNGIGRPFHVCATMLSSGPEIWHPDPDFFYQPGGGPLLDSGPYYLAALIDLLGPVSQVSAISQMVRPERRIASGPREGQTIPVSTPTHITALLGFHSGATATLTTSFDVAGASKQPPIEILCSDGTIALPDSNFFGGRVQLASSSSPDWYTVHGSPDDDSNHRGLGVVEMAMAISAGRPHLATGELAYHQLDVMSAILVAATTQAVVMVTSGVAVAAAVMPKRDDFAL